MLHISIIVPVYKAAEYLDRCVESILAQTFTDFELILVDDGSPDCCGQMCDEWAAKDQRIRVIHKENGGASTAMASFPFLSIIDVKSYFIIAFPLVYTYTLTLP